MFCNDNKQIITYFIIFYAEINEYASKIGIDPASEPHLLHLAKEGLMQALPSDWKPW